MYLKMTQAKIVNGAVTSGTAGTSVSPILLQQSFTNLIYVFSLRFPWPPTA